MSPTQLKLFNCLYFILLAVITAKSAVAFSFHSLQNHYHYSNQRHMNTMRLHSRSLNYDSHDYQSNILMIILVGIPGSGKSTFAEKLVATNPNRFVRINQDKLKSRKKCEQKCRQALSAGKTVIIDRVNFNEEQRRYFIDIAMEFDSCPVDCIFFDYSMDICITRCETRTFHETLNGSKLIRDVVPRMHGLLDIPQSSTDGEVFRKITVVSSFDEANKTVLQYAGRS